MMPATHKALKKSIVKWEKIAAGRACDNGPQDCALCHLFRATNYLFSPRPECCGCPVAEFAGKPGCQGTPYAKWIKQCGDAHIANTPALKKLAQAELNFLKGLLNERT